MRLGYLHGVRDTVLLALHHAGSESPLGVASWYYVLLGRGKNQEILGAVRVLRAHGRAWPLCADDRVLPDSGRHCCHLGVEDQLHERESAHGELRRVHGTRGLRRHVRALPVLLPADARPVLDAVRRGLHAAAEHDSLPRDGSSHAVGCGVVRVSRIPDCAQAA